MVADFQQARLFARYADQCLIHVDERDARVTASYLLARPKALRVLAGLSHCERPETLETFRTGHAGDHRTNTEHLATILLPNPVAAQDTSRYRMDRRRKNPQRKQDVAQLAATG